MYGLSGGYMSHKCEPYCISFKVSTLAQKRHFVACRCKNGVHFLYLFMSVDIWLSLSLDGMGDSRPYMYTHICIRKTAIWRIISI